MNSIFNFFALQLTSNVVLASTVLQTKSVIHTHTHTHTHIYVSTFLGFFSHLGHSVQFSAVAQSCMTLCDTGPLCPSPRRATLSITNSQSLLKLMHIESVMTSSHLILCRPLLPLPPIPPSITVFSNESTLHMRWPKYWSFSFSISPSNERPGLIFFRMD